MTFMVKFSWCRPSAYEANYRQSQPSLGSEREGQSRDPTPWIHTHTNRSFKNHCERHSNAPAASAAMLSSLNTLSFFFLNFLMNRLPGTAAEQEGYTSIFMSKPSYTAGYPSKKSRWQDYMQAMSPVPPHSFQGTYRVNFPESAPSM